MAKFSKATSFKNARIDLNDNTITEYDKDDTRVYSLGEILQQWDGVEGICLTIRQDEAIAPTVGG